MFVEISFGSRTFFVAIVLEMLPMIGINAALNGKSSTAVIVDVEMPMLN